MQAPSAFLVAEADHRSCRRTRSRRPAPHLGPDPNHSSAMRGLDSSGSSKASSFRTNAWRIEAKKAPAVAAPVIGRLASRCCSPLRPYDAGRPPRGEPTRCGPLGEGKTPQDLRYGGRDLRRGRMQDIRIKLGRQGPPQSTTVVMRRASALGQRQKAQFLQAGRPSRTRRRGASLWNPASPRPLRTQRLLYAAIQPRARAAAMTGTWPGRVRSASATRLERRTHSRRAVRSAAPRGLSRRGRPTWARRQRVGSKRNSAQVPELLSHG